MTELGEIGQTGLIRTGDNWKLYDIIFNNSQPRIFPGQPNIQQSFYTVFEARLRRPVPHLVFDSKVAKKRQFNRLYVNAQWLPLESGFTDHFEVYGPKHYQLDALSFITPEVLEAMLAMPDRDVEFLDDSLLCYAPLLAANQLDDFQAKCQRLQHHVDNNLQSYRDSWLRRQARGEGGVTDFGKQLLPNPLSPSGPGDFFWQRDRRPGDRQSGWIEHRLAPSNFLADGCWTGDVGQVSCPDPAPEPASGGSFSGRPDRHSGRQNCPARGPPARGKMIVK